MLVNSAETLLEVAVRSQATDVLLAPGSGAGNLHLRAGSRNILSKPTPSSALEALSQEFVTLARLHTEVPDHTMQLGSFEFGGLRVRVSRTRTQAGSLVRLRLQCLRVLEQAYQEFAQGRYGGLEIRPFLALEAGWIVVAGLPSAGKTSALAHLCASLERELTVVSEAHEIGSSQFSPQGRSYAEVIDPLLRQGSRSPVVLDEMDESLKLKLATRLGSSRLVLLTVTAPNLAACVHKLVASKVPIEDLLGFLTVDWQTHESEGRWPRYSWFPTGENRVGHCARCGLPRPQEGPCPNCSLPPIPRVLDRAVLRRLNTPEGFRAVERLQEEWMAT